MKKLANLISTLVHQLVVLAGAGGLTLSVFLVLPLIQAITKPPAADTMLQSVDTANVPPPPAAPEEEPEPEPEKEEPPPSLEEEAQPLSLDQLELAMNFGEGGVGEGYLGGDFAVNLNTVTGGAVAELFSLSDLDTPPRAVHQPSPRRDAKVRRKSPGKVVVIFIVDEKGRVVDPRVQSSSDRVFERPALAAVKQWRFEPGKRGGKPVRTRIRQSITFPK